MNMIDKILSKLFKPYRFKIKRKGQDLLIKSIINSLPKEYLEFKTQIKSLTFHGLTDWTLFPDYKFIYFSYPENTLNEYKKRGENYQVSGIEIFSIKNKRYESIEILVNDNLFSGLQISNSDYTQDEFDLDKINTKNISKSDFDFPPNEIDLFYDSLDSEVKHLLNPDEIFDIDYNNRTFYAFYDLEDGNYLAVDKNQNVYSLIHDAKPAATKIKYTFGEILTDIKESRFEKDKHVDERYRKSK